MKKNIYVLTSLFFLIFGYQNNSYTANDGSLDITFNALGAFPGVPGVQSIPNDNFGAGTLRAQANALQIQSNGYIVVAGTATIPTVGITMFIARFTPTGAFDPTFNGTGIVVIPLTSFGTGTTSSQANALQIQPNGSIVVAGIANPTAAGGQSMSIVRLTSTGTLDPSFNGTGIVTIPLTSFGSGAAFAQSNALQIQPNGSIVVAGTANPTAAGGTSMSIVRITSIGTLDLSFNGTGIFTIPVTSFGSGTIFSEANALQIQADGSIVVAGTANPTAAGGGSMAIALITSAGSLDISFNSNNALPGVPGIATIPLTSFGPGTSISNAFDVQIQSNGSIVLAGEANPTAAGSTSMSVARLTSTGELDTTFNTVSNTAGTVTIPLTSFGSFANVSRANALQIQADGKILIAGFANPREGGIFHAQSTSLARFTSAGILDTTLNPVGAFPGVPGVETILQDSFENDAATLNQAQALQIQSNGYIVMAGFANQTFLDDRHNVSLVRLTNTIIIPPSTSSAASALTQAIIDKYCPATLTVD